LLFSRVKKRPTERLLAFSKNIYHTLSLNTLL
jgi:hypothetical protein